MEPRDPAFATAQEAIDWLDDSYDEFAYADNFRFAFLDDPAGLAEYDRIERAGCCGSGEVEVVVAGRPAKVGCNYGH